MFRNIFLLVLLGFVVLPQTAHAYLDPGTVSYVFQIIVASLIGGAYVFRGYIVAFKNKLFGSSAPAEKSDDSAVAEKAEVPDETKEQG